MTFTQSQPGTAEYHRAGTTLSHQVRPGTGTPLVLVPGVMADAATWHPVAAAIELPNPVITLNRRGRAPSGALGADYSVDVEIADLRHILEQVGHAHLFGWSYGALIALEAALDTTHVRSVTAYEPVGRPFAPSVVPRLRRAIADGDLDEAVTLINIEVSGFSAEYVAELRRGPAWPALRTLAAPLAAELAAINSHRTAPPSPRSRPRYLRRISFDCQGRATWHTSKHRRTSRAPSRLPYAEPKPADETGCADAAVSGTASARAVGACPVNRASDRKRNRPTRT